MIKQSHEPVIRLSQLSNGLHEFRFAPAASEIGLGGNFLDKVTVTVALEKGNRQLYLKVAIGARGVFQCDRCVEEFERKLSTGYTAFYVYDELDAGKYTENDVKIITPDTLQLDLTEDICESAMLAVPLKLLCNERCKGLCPHCGANWNRQNCMCEKDDVGDPRWDALKNFLDNKTLKE